VGTSVFTGAALSAGAGGSPFDARSPQAAAIADLFTSALVICGGVFLVVAVLVFYCAYKFRGSGATEPIQVEGHRRLEIGWTLAPVLVLGLLLMLTVRAMNGSDPPIDRDPDVIIVGHQWWWEVRYPSGVVTANEVHIPTGKALVFRLESADVIHDFWVPELGRKMDATPGRPTSIWLEADTAGTYLGTCAEYCGLQHAWMRILVVAEAPDKFAEWQRHELAPPPVPTGEVAARGEALFRSMACVNCHSTGSSDSIAVKARYAPDLRHLAERTTLGAGVLANTPAELGRWLKDPQSIKTGCHMPDTQLKDSQVTDLVAYLETLQ
jgi:cytochrome c oxidase subunit 2